MKTVQEHIQIVIGKLQQLVKKHASLQRENEMLNREVNELKVKEDNYKNVIYALDQKVNILKAASGNMTEADRKEFEKRVDHYIREIDKCIGILSE